MNDDAITWLARRLWWEDLLADLESGWAVNLTGLSEIDLLGIDALLAGQYPENTGNGVTGSRFEVARMENKSCTS